MAVVFVFVDGVGAGASDPAVNPLARSEFLLSRFADGTGAPLPHGGRSTLADACLGVAGRPQSATGQSTIFTGENAARAIGRHLLGFPNAPLRKLLRQRSIFGDLARDGLRSAFVNAYPVAYLKALGLPCDGDAEFVVPPRRARASATTVAYAAAPGCRFRTWNDARRGEALTHDIDAHRANALGAAIPHRGPEGAAGVIAAVAAENDLTVFEFFETDEAGHAQSMERAIAALARLDAFLRALVGRLGPDVALVVASDHGNVEDLSTRNHTLAPVPVLGFGRAAERVQEVRDLTQIAPLLRGLATPPRRKRPTGARGGTR